jgi:hypothetical protein
MGAPARNSRGQLVGQALDLTTRQVSILADRLDRAVGLVGLEPDEHGSLQRILLAEEFGPFDPADPPAAPAATPTAAAPGTAGRVSAMVARQRLRLPLACFGDAGPADGRPPPEYVLMVRLAATTEADAKREAKVKLGCRAKYLPAGASVEVV